MEKGHGMIYTENIQVDDQGRFVECPVCKNTEFSDDAQYCKICGMNRSNLCIPDDSSYQHYIKSSKPQLGTCIGLRLLLFWQIIRSGLLLKQHFIYHYKHVWQAQE